MQYTFKLIDSITSKVFMPSLESSSQLSVRFSPLITANTLRTLDGSSVRSALNWIRGNISISGSGSAAPGFDNLEVANSYFFHSNQPRSESVNFSVGSGVLTASSVVSLLPFSVRNDTDYKPFLLVSYTDGTTQAFDDTVTGTTSRSYSCAVGTTRTVESVTEVYFPIYEVYTSPAAVDYDARNNVYGWSLELELV